MLSPYERNLILKKIDVWNRRAVGEDFNSQKTEISLPISKSISQDHIPIKSEEVRHIRDQRLQFGLRVVDRSTQFPRRPGLILHNVQA